MVWKAHKPNLATARILNEAAQWIGRPAFNNYTITSSQRRHGGVKEASCLLKPKPYTHQKARGLTQSNSSNTHAQRQKPSPKQHKKSLSLLGVLWSDLAPLIPVHPMGQTQAHTHTRSLHQSTVQFLCQHVDQWQVDKVLGGQEVQASDLGVALASGPGTQAGHPGSKWSADSD